MKTELHQPIRDYWTDRADETYACPIDELPDGWEIVMDEDHRLILVSPGTSVESLRRTECEGCEILFDRLREILGDEDLQELIDHQR